MLGRFLRSLGVPPAEVPGSEEEAAALFRGAVADRRLLFVLDNAAGPDQVAALIPGTPSCAVLVTSRQPLLALDTEGRFRVERLSDADALDLLGRLTGGLADDTSVARSIVASCGGLPLAVRIAAGRLVSRPDMPVGEYAARLDKDTHQLAEPQRDDRAVRASIRAGYDALVSGRDAVAEAAAQGFRALGAYPIPEVTPGVLAALLGEPDAEIVRSVLDRLVDTQLLEPAAGGRFRLHDLVRLVATECVAEESTPADREAMRSRAIAYHASALRATERRIRPVRVLPFGEPPLDSDAAPPGFSTPAHARAWIDRELANLVAAVEMATAATGEAGRLALWLSEAVWMCLDARCEWPAAHRMSRRVLEVAEQRRDRELAACGHLLMGRSDACLARFEPAVAHLGEAVRLLHDLANQSGHAVALNGLGLAHERRGDYMSGLSCYVEALALARRCDLVDLAASVQSNMACCYLALGRIEEALAAAEYSVENGTVAIFGLNLAAVHLMRGDQMEAVRWFSCAVSATEERGDRQGRCEALLLRSEAYLRLGDPIAAEVDVAAAFTLADTSGYRHVRAAASLQQSKILAVTGREAAAERMRALAVEAYAALNGAHRDLIVDLVLAPTA